MGNCKVLQFKGTRPERWYISVRNEHKPSICCFYSERGECWVGYVEVTSMEMLSGLMTRAEGLMKAAQASNTRLEVAV